jgi:hypothetical protein
MADHSPDPRAVGICRSLRPLAMARNVFAPPARISAITGAIFAARSAAILTLVDDFTRECPGLVVDTSLTGLRIARELDRIAELRG